jgi:hypothetical protein
MPFFEYFAFFVFYFIYRLFNGFISFPYRYIFPLMAKEIFLGDIQQNSRLCAPLHFSFTAEPIAPFQQMPAKQVLNAIERRLQIDCSFVVHLISPQKIVLSFPDHAEAIRAQKFAYEDNFFYVSGCRYRFAMDDSPVYCRRITTDQRVVISIRQLPLHMWSGQIAEQILSPYCIVEYIEIETRTMEDLFSYVCIARSQRGVVIPSKIKVITADDVSCLCSETGNILPLAIRSYNIFIDKTEFMAGVTRRYPYAPAVASAENHIVNHEVYITSNLLDQTLVDKYSTAVVLTVRNGCYFESLVNVCQTVYTSCQLRVEVRVLREKTYLLFFHQIRANADLYTLLASIFEESISDNEISIQRWTTHYNSAESNLSYLSNLTLTGIPCNFCTPLIVEYIVGAFALVQRHDTKVNATNDQCSVAGRSIYRYHCSVWCVHPDLIPRIVVVKMLPAHLASHIELSKVVKAICSVLEIHITVAGDAV